MMKWRIITVIVVACFSRLTNSASCCKTTNGEREANMSGEEKRETLLRGIQAMDRLHRYWFQRRLLAALRIDEAPAEAALWRRRREQQRRSISSAERNSDGNVEEEPSYRRYTLRIIGIPDTHRPRRDHRRRHNGGHARRRLEDAQCASEFALHYSFHSKFSSPFSTQQYETELEKAELELWTANETLPHLQLRNEPNGDNNEDPLMYNPSASWSMASRRDSGWSSFRLIQGHVEHENSSLFVADITDALRSLWSVTAGANVTISLVHQNGPESMPCIQSMSPERNVNQPSHHRRAHNHSHHQDVDEVRSPLVLKLTLKEKATQRVAYKRSINRIGATNTRVNTTNGRRANRQLIIEDCERQWDSGFLRETPTAQYDDLMPCCRRKVHIDFSDLGWGSWVIAPLSFDSYYCMGRCTNFGGFASADTDGAAFYTEAMNLYRDARNSGLTPCCSPVKFSPLTITVLTGDNEEMTQTLEDVVVKQCGCM